MDEISNMLQYREALARLEDMMDKSYTGLEEIASLATLIEKYEKDNFPIEEPSYIEALKFREDQEK